MGGGYISIREKRRVKEGRKRGKCLEIVRKEERRRGEEIILTHRMGEKEGEERGMPGSVWKHWIDERAGAKTGGMSQLYGPK